MGVPGGGSYTYDAENHLVSTAGVNYTYDGDGERVEKSNGEIYWYTSGGEVLDETDLSGNLTGEYVFFGGARIARRDASGNVFYYLADHLDSSRVMAEIPAGGTTATLCYDADFYPFGGERAYTNSCQQNYKFTGKERDPESGLDNFEARYYGSSVGRFMSADDPFVGWNLADPQSLNLYAYVQDNPINDVDPSGHCIGMNNSENGHQGYGFFWSPSCSMADIGDFMDADPSFGADAGANNIDTESEAGQMTHLQESEQQHLNNVAEDIGLRAVASSLQKALQQKGVAAGQTYKTMNQAAFAAEKSALSATNKAGRKYEFGGWILNNGKGEFTYTNPVTDRSQGEFDPESVTIPNGYTVAADYHTHAHNYEEEGEGLSAGDEQHAYDYNRTVYEADTYSRNLYRFTPGVSQFKQNEWCCGVIGDFVAHIKP